MAANSIIPSRALLEALHPVRRRPACQCIQTATQSRRIDYPQNRYVSTASAQLSEMEVEKDVRPRWAQTPPAMKAPIPTKARPNNYTPLKCNTDPRKLDDFYLKFLGSGGDKMLSEETKWLAVTHKSFDHGRRGFNDRLAFLGKRIVELQLSLALLTGSKSSKYLKDYQDPHGRVSFSHPAIENVEVLLGNAKTRFTHHKEISQLAENYNISSVVRWQPKNLDSLAASGSDMIYAQAVFAIVGAIALEQGGAVANKIATERIIAPLGVKIGEPGRIAEPVKYVCLVPLTPPEQRLVQMNEMLSQLLWNLGIYSSARL